MTGVAEALWRAILEHPDDDPVRLVYADWLEEHGGQERAELIRAQVELARLGEFDPRRPALEDREAELLARHGPEWRSGLAGEAGVWAWRRFHRGFIDSLDVVDPSAFLRLGDSLFERAPIRHLRVFAPD